MYLAGDLLQIAVVLLVAGARLVPPGLVFELVLLWGLGRWSKLCWMFSFAETVLGAAAPVLIGARGNVLAIDLAAVSAPGAALALVLLSAPMRRHVGLIRR